MDATWVTWVLQFLIAALLARVWYQIDKNTDAITVLREYIPTHYLPKREFEYFRGETDKSIHDLRNDVHVNDTQVAELRTQVDNLTT